LTFEQRRKKVGVVKVIPFSSKVKRKNKKVKDKKKKKRNLKFTVPRF
jgi:hypothetical protein